MIPTVRGSVGGIWVLCSTEVSGKWRLRDPGGRCLRASVLHLPESLGLIGLEIGGLLVCGVQLHVFQRAFFVAGYTHGSSVSYPRSLSFLQRVGNHVWKLSLQALLILPGKWVGRENRTSQQLIQNISSLQNNPLSLPSTYQRLLLC